jgi:adenine-specific DNA-methyltransferase
MTMNLVEYVDKATIQYINNNRKSIRKKSGQFFTPASVASFMGSMIDSDKSELNILDAGGGTGILTAAVCQKIADLGKTHRINVDIYENNLQVHTVLESNLLYIQKSLESKGIEASLRIIPDNFIVSNCLEWTGLVPHERYDLVISNPPYKKIGKNEAEANTMPEIVYGQPNLYFLFMAMGARLLKKDGELIYIVPRSFSSGLYFSSFRNWFFENVKLTNLHIFTSRKQVFKTDDILQETVILRAKKTDTSLDFITITESVDSKMKLENDFSVSYEICLTNDHNHFLYIPANQQDIKVLNFINQWKGNLCDIGFKMKTGVVVDFRETMWLRTQKENNTIPLLWSYNLKNNRMIFPANDKDKPQYLLACPNTAKLQMRVDNYVILKRFTSKEESKRLQCAILMKEDFDKYTGISTENHLNFITKVSGNMTPEEMFGIFVVLNSGYMDKYFRILSGSTQVNATEINKLPFPNYEDVVALGAMAMQCDSLDEQTCDKLLESKYTETSTAIAV